VQAESKQAQPAQQDPATTYATPTADQLYQLVAPIALFPDNLVAQVLAASTFPDEIADAHTWLQQNSKLKGEQLMQAADKQPWDESVKGLTQFADVLNQMATNLSWTSALGDAYFNIPQSVMNAVQVMRDRAYKAGNLKTSQQQDVTVQNQTAASADDRNSARATRGCLRSNLQSHGGIRSSRGGVSRLFDRGPSSHEPAIFRGRGSSRGGGEWRRLLRMGLELVGSRLAEFHRDLQPQHLCLEV
jgi:Protein of unknown function (DUF3300)